MLVVMIAIFAVSVATFGQGNELKPALEKVKPVYAAEPAEAKSIVKTNPAVKSGIFNTDMSLWYGSASLMATPRSTKRSPNPSRR